MAVVYNKTASAILLNSDTGADIGLYTVDGVAKKWSGASDESTCQSALDDMLKKFGYSEFRIVQDVSFTVTGVVVTTP